MLAEVILFIIGLAVLIKGADFVVDSAAKIAKQFGVSDFVVGLTIVAVGTSLPELAASVTAALYGDTALAVGNIIGSNIANIGLILGLTALFVVIRINKEIHSRDGFIMLFAVLAFYAFSFDGVVSRWEGGFLIWLFIAYILFFLTKKRKYRYEFHFGQYFSELMDVKKRSPEFNDTLYAGLDYYAYKELLKGVFYEVRRMLTVTSDIMGEQASAITHLLKQLALLALGIASVLVGADMVVTSSTSFPIPSVVIGLVFVSIGTSLPELAVALSAIKKRYQNIMIGNVIGSNIANILLVGALAALARPLVVSPQAMWVFFPVLLGFTWLFLVFSRNDQRIHRIEAITLLLAYAAFIGYLFFGVLF